ncbi:hypothetical protein EPO15_06785 [bacterium]|nr:MAG: hypothetical protein EPO15_06785 [bacterium]
MTGYALHVRMRRAGSQRASERTLQVSDAALARLRRGALFALAAALFLLAPFAMAALTSPEKGRRDVFDHSGPPFDYAFPEGTF